MTRNYWIRSTGRYHYGKLEEHAVCGHLHDTEADRLIVLKQPPKLARCARCAGILRMQDQPVKEYPPTRRPMTEKRMRLKEERVTKRHRRHYHKWIHQRLSGEYTSVCSIEGCEVIVSELEMCALDDRTRRLFNAGLWPEVESITLKESDK